MFSTPTSSGVLEKQAADGMFKRIPSHLSNPATRLVFVFWTVQDLWWKQSHWNMLFSESIVFRRVRKMANREY